MERQMKNFMKKGGQVSQMKPKMPGRMSGRMVARGSLSGKERMVNPYGGKSFVRSEEADLDEAPPSAMQVKQGIGIARDKRYAKGNVTGAVRAMNKVNPGLAQHPVVKKELQKQNEEVEIDERCWDGYTARGMKKKDGRMVPNCVPTTEQNDLVSRYLSRASVHQEAVTYDSGFRKMAPVKDRFGNKVKNVAQHLARQGMQAAMKDLKKGPEAGKKQVS